MWKYQHQQAHDRYKAGHKAFRRYKMICLAVDMLLRAGKKVEDWNW